MKTFTDSAGRSWTISLTIDAAKRVKTLLEVNLLELEAGWHASGRGNAKARGVRPRLSTSRPAPCHVRATRHASPLRVEAWHPAWWHGRRHSPAL
ncbi:MAG TPA: hypothetical protein VNA25_15760 [Phycisphaerae bacterium]|nr:hypothetical protein [Phycisphaerae bacterium]